MHAQHAMSGAAWHMPLVHAPHTYTHPNPAVAVQDVAARYNYQRDARKARPEQAAMERRIVPLALMHPDQLVRLPPAACTHSAQARTTAPALLRARTRAPVCAGLAATALRCPPFYVPRAYGTSRTQVALLLSQLPGRRSPLV